MESEDVTCLLTEVELRELSQSLGKLIPKKHIWPDEEILR